MLLKYAFNEQFLDVLKMDNLTNLMQPPGFLGQCFNPVNIRYTAYAYAFLCMNVVNSYFYFSFF